MALNMARPTKHPRTGIYHVRLAVPEPLRATAKALLGAGRELVENLRTKDPKVAKEAAAAAVARLQAKLAAVRDAHAGLPPKVPEQAIHALAGAFYREQMDHWGADPGHARRWEAEQFAILDAAEDGPVDDDRPMDEGNRQLLPTPSEADWEASRRLLQGAGYQPIKDAVDRLAVEVAAARFRFAQVMEARARGDWRQDRTPEEFPPLPQLPSTAPREASLPAGPTVDALLRGWALDAGHSPDAKPVSRAYYDRMRTMEKLVAFVGHREALRITKADAVRWKESMQAQPKPPSPLTIRNDFSEMSAIWRNAIRNGRVPEGCNPFYGISPPKPKSRAPKRRPFTKDEAVTILRAAREKTGYMRWVPWVCCLTGARLSEICQGTTEDIAEVDGVVVLSITDEGDDDEAGVRSLKNEGSRRQVPIHPTLIAEGFLDYIKGLRPGSALFPDTPPDTMFGRRGTNTSKAISRWMRGTLEITDPKISPNHSWRHWFIDACRKTGMHPEVRKALTGHTGGQDEGDRYGVGMGSFVGLLAEAIAKVEPPVEPLGPRSVLSKMGQKA